VPSERCFEPASFRGRLQSEGREDTATFGKDREYT
jgi:hypothetical protein